MITTDHFNYFSNFFWFLLLHGAKAESFKIQGICVLHIAENLYECDFENIEFIIDKEIKIDVEVEHHSVQYTDNDVTILGLFGTKTKHLIHLQFINKFPNIREIIFVENILVFPNAVENCQNIVKMYFEKTNLSSIPENFFGNCINLEQLFLMKTFILAHSSTDFFQKLPNLRILGFDQEEIFLLELEQLKSLGNLKSLSFFECHIHSTEEAAFKNLKSLVLLRTKNSVEITVNV